MILTKLDWSDEHDGNKTFDILPLTCNGVATKMLWPKATDTQIWGTQVVDICIGCLLTICEFQATSLMTVLCVDRITNE